jgi:small conductance mechanosensitive channel
MAEEAPSLAEQARGMWEALLQQGVGLEMILLALTELVVPAVFALLVLLVAYVVGRWLGRAVGERVAARVDVTLGRFLDRSLKWTILVLALLGVLSVFGFSVATFAALIAAMGLAIGLAFQGTLSNFAAGVMLLAFRPFKVGDVVNAGGVFGIVHEIDLFTTRIDTFDNRRFIVPNGGIFGQTIENVSHHPERRVEVKVGVAYGADLDRTREVLQEAVDAIEGVIPGENRGTMVFLSDLGDSSVNWAVRCWVAADQYWPTHQALVRSVKRHLDEAGIGIPFPQRDVHLHQANPGT